MTTTGALTSDPDGGTTVVLTRRFPAPVEDVWASITESDRLARWFGTWTGDPADGSVMVTMNAEGEAVPASCYAIDVCEPPHRLVVRTVDDTGSWTLSAELSEDDGTTTLVFAQHGIEPELVPDVGPGWEWYLDRLDAAVVGRSGPSLDDFERELPSRRAAYAALVAERRA
jgi:uncharacterized protein YndB with AHSA1/START domain